MVQLDRQDYFISPSAGQLLLIPELGMEDFVFSCSGTQA